MTAMIQIRNVPTDVHRELKARAARAGKSLSDYLLTEARRSLERPTMEELLARVKTRSPVVTSESPAEILRAERDRE
jgi:plasmid stability protein